MTDFTSRFLSLRVTPKTVWLFLSLSDGDMTGWGEATLDRSEQNVSDCFDTLPKRLSESDIASLRLDTLPQAALASALHQAAADLAARKAGVPLSTHLGGTGRARVGVYANINRCSLDRSPQGMAATAVRAVAQGHIAVKIAPFDEVQPRLARHEMTQAMAKGLDRIAAVRDAIGNRRLMVDCHWRFSTQAAMDLIDACAPFNLHWIECPIAETLAEIPALVSLRARANAAGMRLAGLETAILRQGFAPYLAAGAYDVMMPDVKYCGGPLEMLAIADDMARHGVTFSPHNPTGPICHAHSAHLCAAMAQSDLLEMQFDETPMFETLVDMPLLPPASGEVRLSAAPGIGLQLVAPRMDHAKK